MVSRGSLCPGRRYLLGIHMESFRDTHGILDTINFYIQKFELYPRRGPRVDTSLSGGSLVAAALVDVGSLQREGYYLK